MVGQETSKPKLVMCALLPPLRGLAMGGKSSHGSLVRTWLVLGLLIRTKRVDETTFHGAMVPLIDYLYNIHSEVTFDSESHTQNSIRISLRPCAKPVRQICTFAETLYWTRHIGNYSAIDSVYIYLHRSYGYNVSALSITMQIIRGSRPVNS
jgi:hypothetical protein